MATSQGNLGLMLANNESPCTVNSFASLIGQKYFDNTKCHRLTTSSSLGVLQCGDPKGDGTGGPGYQFGNEYPTDQYPPNDPKAQQPVVYPRGTLAMANAGPGTNGSQFFLVYKDSELPPRVHRLRHDSSRRAGRPGQDRQGRRRRRRRRRAAGQRSPDQVDTARLKTRRRNTSRAHRRVLAVPQRRHLMVSPVATDSFGHYELRELLGRGGMGKSFVPTTPPPTGSSPSRCFRRIWPRTTSFSSASAARHALPPASTTRTSCRFTATARSTADSTSTCGSSRAATSSST